MDKLEAIGEPGLRAALVFARGQPRPVTADELAEAQGVHRNVARSRLERLTRARLLVPGFERRSGRTGPGAGRPAKTYAVAPELDAVEFPGGRLEQLLSVLLDAVPPARLREVGVSLARELARAARLRPAKTLQGAVERMCGVLRSAGYQAAVVEVTRQGAVVETLSCPLRPLVRARPDAVELDRGMWAGLLARALSGLDVERVDCNTADCLGDHTPCRVRIRLRSLPRPARAGS